MKLLNKYSKKIDEFVNNKFTETNERIEVSNFMDLVLFEMYDDFYNNIKSLIESGEISIVVNDIELKKTDKIKLSR